MIELFLPCGCKMEVSPEKIRKNGGMLYIKSLTCIEHKRLYTDFFIRKVSNDKYKAIINKKDERKIFDKESNFYVIYFNTGIAKCSNCGKILRGKNVEWLENVRRNQWELTMTCSSCKTTDIYYFNENLDIIDE